MIFGNKIIKENNEEIELVDLYEYMVYSTKEEQEFFNEFVISDFMEVKCLNEGMEYINEGLIDTIKKYIDKFIKFVKDLFDKAKSVITNRINKAKTDVAKAKANAKKEKSDDGKLSYVGLDEDTYDAIQKRITETSASVVIGRMRIDLLDSISPILNPHLDGGDDFDKCKEKMEELCSKMKTTIEDTLNFIKNEEKKKSKIEIDNPEKCINKAQKELDWLRMCIIDIKDIDKDFEELRKSWIPLFDENHKDIDEKERQKGSSLLVSSLAEYKKILTSLVQTLMYGTNVLLSHNENIIKSLAN